MLNVENWMMKTRMMNSAPGEYKVKVVECWRFKFPFGHHKTFKMFFRFEIISLFKRRPFSSSDSGKFAIENQFEIWVESLKYVNLNYRNLYFCTPVFKLSIFLIFKHVGFQVEVWMFLTSSDSHTCQSSKNLCQFTIVSHLHVNVFAC